MLNCRYSYNQKVKVKKGFYKGYTGRIEEVKQDKQNNFIYTVNLERANKVIEIEESALSVSLF